MNDDIDDYYECIWDLALLESLISKLDFSLNFIQKKSSYFFFYR